MHKPLNVQAAWYKPPFCRARSADFAGCSRLGRAPPCFCTFAGSYGAMASHAQRNMRQESTTGGTRTGALLRTRPLIVLRGRGRAIDLSCNTWDSLASINDMRGQHLYIGIASPAMKRLYQAVCSGSPGSRLTNIAVSKRLYQTAYRRKWVKLRRCKVSLADTADYPLQT